MDDKAIVVDEADDIQQYRHRGSHIYFEVTILSTKGPIALLAKGTIHPK